MKLHSGLGLDDKERMWAQKIFIVCVFFLFFISPFSDFIEAALNELPEALSFYTGLIFILRTASSIIAILAAAIVSPILTLSFYSVLVVFYSFSWFFYPINRVAIAEYFPTTFVFCGAAFLCFAIVNKDKRFWDTLVRFSRFSLIFTVAEFPFVAQGIYSMEYSQGAILPMAIVSSNFVVKRVSMFDTALMVVAFVCIVLHGSRASLAYIVLFVILLIWYKVFVVDRGRLRQEKTASGSYVAKMRIQHKLDVIASSSFYFGVIFLVLAALSVMLIPVIVEELQAIGFSSRNLSAVATGNAFGLSGRDIYWQEVLGKLAEEPLVGLGLCGDSVHMTQNVFHLPLSSYQVEWQFRGYYSHNIVVELLAQHGLVVGSILVIALLVVSFEGMKRAHESRSLRAMMLATALFCCGFLPLILSNSYLISVGFWSFLGTCAYCIKNLHARDKAVAMA